MRIGIIGAGVVDRGLVLASLGAAPGLARAMTQHCTAEPAWRPPKPGEWSIGEVVRHLVEGERDTFLPRLRRMIVEDRPVFGARTRSAAGGADLETLLGAFTDARRQSVEILATLEEEAWRREGVSPSRGALTIETYARTMAEHDVEHLGQMQDVRAVLGLPPRRCEARQALPIADLVIALQAGPPRFARVAQGLTAAELRRRPADGEWSIKEVMAHLAHVERVGLSGFFGPVTLAAYATHAADHDLEHLAQTEACRAAL